MAALTAKMVGALAFQMPVDETNKVMTGNQHWQQDGLGNSGETILVGHDGLMRSSSRLFLENPAAFLNLHRFTPFNVRSSFASPCRSCW